MSALAWAALTAMGDDFSWMDNICKGADTSLDHKRRKERARMLSLARQEELRNNPKPPKKKRGKKRK